MELDATQHEERTPKGHGKISFDVSQPYSIHLIGRTGNQMFQWCHAKSYCEQNGLELHTNPWVGQRIFDIDDPPIVGQPIQNYFQDQKSLIYTRTQAKKWFTFRPEIAERLQCIVTGGTIAHRRTGDYEACGYVVVSLQSYYDAVKKFELPEPHFITESLPSYPGIFDNGLSFLPDFYRMMKATNLLRANSSFSWWAATLGTARVFAPIIDGKTGGKEQDCEFVEGNWPRLANLEFTTELRLEE